MTNHTDGGFDVPDGFEIPDLSQNVEFFTGTDGPDTPRFEFADAVWIAVGYLADQAETTAEGLPSDDAVDQVIVNGTNFLDRTGLPDDVDARSGVLLGFGPQDTLTLDGLSGDQAQVFLFRNEDVPNVPDDFFFGGAVISFQDAGAIVVSDTGREPFSGQADFNDRVTFGEGGTPQFNEAPALGDILADFEQNGVLPSAEIPGVFELPNEPQPGDTVDLPPITITIGGEEITFDPGDPFWFDDIPAEAREELLADPEIAVGYDYRLMEPADGQAFATIRAPRIGDDRAYNLVVLGPDGTAQPEQAVTAGETINFETTYDFPVTNFLLEGIDPTENVDPDDPQAFPLVVSFTQSGAVDMQQTPLVRGFEFKVDDDGDYPDLAAAFYVGYYGRAAEPGGLTFWSEFIEGRVVGGQPVDELIQEISARFADENETATLYPFLGAERQGGANPDEADAFVNQVYENLFNRPAEQAGEDFWSDRIVTRTEDDQSIADIIVSFVNGAQGNDAVAIGNKIEVASQFGRAFTDADFADLDFDLTELIAGVDETDASVTAAEQAIEAAGGVLPSDSAIVGSSTGGDPLMA